MRNTPINKDFPLEKLKTQDSENMVTLTQV